MAFADVLASIDEASLVRWLSIAMLGTAVPTMVALVLGKKAAYGRYAETDGKAFGFMVNGRIAWMVQEAPCVAHFALAAYAGLWTTTGTANKILAGLFLAHYINR